VKPGLSDGSFTEIAPGPLAEGRAVIVEAIARTRGSAGLGPRMF
jgi:hypothetical protein